MSCTYKIKILYIKCQYSHFKEITFFDFVYFKEVHYSVLIFFRPFCTLLIFSFYQFFYFNLNFKPYNNTFCTRVFPDLIDLCLILVFTSFL